MSRARVVLSGAALVLSRLRGRNEAEMFHSLLNL